MHQVTHTHRFLNPALSNLLAWALFCVFAFPFIQASYFTTLDGPGHIHNAKIIQSLLFDSDSFWSSYFQLNGFISPNFLGHYILLIVLQLVGEVFADRLMLIICMAALFGSLRYLLKGFGYGGSVLLLPLVFLINTPLFSGFFTFTLGLSAMFFALGYYARIRAAIHSNHIQVGAVIKLSCLLAIVYLFHLVPAVLTCILVVVAFFIEAIRQHGMQLRNPRVFIKSSKQVILALIPVSLLIILYQLHDQETGQFNYIARQELWRQWGVLQGLIINHRHEWSFTRWYWYIPAFALVADLALTRVNHKLVVRSQFSAAPLIFWLSALLILAILYFTLPDATSGGGALSVRLNFLLIIVGTVLLFSLVRTRWIQVLAISALLVVTFDHRQRVLTYHEEHAFFMKDIEELVGSLQEPGVLLVHRFRYDWPYEHATKYLGRHYDIVMADALGGHKIYAPVMWKPAYRNRQELVAMFDRGWQRNPDDILSLFPSERIYVLTIGEVLAEDSTAWASWTSFMSARGAVKTITSDSLMSLYSFRQ